MAGMAVRQKAWYGSNWSEIITQHQQNFFLNYALCLSSFARLVCNELQARNEIWHE